MANYTNYKFNGTDLSLTLKPYFKGSTIITNLKVKNQYYNNVDLGSIFQPRSTYGVLNNTLSNLGYKVNNKDISELFDSISVVYVTITWSVSTNTPSETNTTLNINSANNVDTIDLTITYVGRTSETAQITSPTNTVTINTYNGSFTIQCSIKGNLIKTIQGRPIDDGGTEYTTTSSITLNRECMYCVYFTIVGGGGGGGGGGTDAIGGDPQGAGGGGGGSGGVVSRYLYANKPLLNINYIGSGGGGGGTLYSGGGSWNIGNKGGDGTSTIITINSSNYTASNGTGGWGGGQARKQAVTANGPSYKGIGGTGGNNGNDGSTTNDQAIRYTDDYSQTHGGGGNGGTGGPGFKYISGTSYGTGGNGGYGGYNWGSDGASGANGVCYVIIYYFTINYT